MKEKFISALDAARKQIGGSTRSQFIRDAIIEKLFREGIHVPKELASPPQRVKVVSYFKTKLTQNLRNPKQ